MSAHISNLMLQLDSNPDEASFFSAVFPLINDDPRGVLSVLEAAEAKKLSTPRILTARILAHIALREPQPAYQTYKSYLDACRAAGGFDQEPPFDSLHLFFDEVNERAWATEVREVAAMECEEFLGKVISKDHAELTEVSVQLDVQLETIAADDTEQVARKCALKACVLQKLGKKAEALKFWGKAKEASPEIADFWKANSLLA